MCLETVGVWLRSWVVQAKARFRYRIDKAHAARARKRWIKRQKSVIRANYQQDCHSDPLDHLGHHPYKPTTYVSDSEDEECRLTYNSDQGVGVLSPQRLSQRLNENALAREAVGESDAELAQYLKDERIALFLQNDEFINELRTNREFMTALQEVTTYFSAADYQSEAADDEEVDGTEVKGQLAHLDDATLRERIATMGKASRKKFAQIAKVFSRRKRSGGRSLLPSTGREQLLISADPLIEDDDDDRQLQQVEGNMAASPRHLR